MRAPKGLTARRNFGELIRLCQGPSQWRLCKKDGYTDMSKAKSSLHSLNKSGQATTELAVFAFVLLIAFASLLKYGQLMNEQQEVRMHAFRQGLKKAYYDYEDGDGFGGTAYTTIKNVHIVNPFRVFYDGNQRQRLSGGAVLLWDPDIFYIEEDDDQAKPHTYVELDEKEVDIGKKDKIREIVTNATIDLRYASQNYNLDTSRLTENIQASTDEHLSTKIKLKDEDDNPIGNKIIDQYNSYSKDQTWVTSWD